MNQSGATAGSKEFGSREKAVENQYVREKVKFIQCIFYHLQVN
jgi:hypothetical protein